MALSERQREYREVYLRSAHWQQTSKAARERASNACEQCGYVGRLDVHHLTYKRIGEELPEDLVALCRTCHDNAHGIDWQKKVKQAVKRRRRERKRLKKQQRRREVATPVPFVSDRDRDRTRLERAARVKAEKERRAKLKAEFTPNRPPVRSIPFKDKRKDAAID